MSLHLHPHRVLIRMLVLCMIACWRCEAMTPDQFVQFLVEPPAYGRVVAVMSNPVYGESRVVISNIAQVYEHLWNKEDRFTVQRTDGGASAEGGTYRGVEWGHFQNVLQMYAGTNDTDQVRRGAVMNQNLALLMRLGLDSRVITASARLDGSTLVAEIDSPAAREKFGVNPRLRGTFSLNDRGEVEQLEYVYVVPTGEESLTKFVTRYEYEGNWGQSFPSRISLHEASNSRDAEKASSASLEILLEVEEWDVSRMPEVRAFDPAVAFPKAKVISLSNNTLIDLKTGRSSPASAARSRSAMRLVVLMFLAALAVTFGWYTWREAKRRRATQ